MGRGGKASATSDCGPAAAASDRGASPGEGPAIAGGGAERGAGFGRAGSSVRFVGAAGSAGASSGPAACCGKDKPPVSQSAKATPIATPTMKRRIEVQDICRSQHRLSRVRQHTPGEVAGKQGRAMRGVIRRAASSLARRFRSGRGLTVQPCRRARTRKRCRRGQDPSKVRIGAATNPRSMSASGCLAPGTLLWLVEGVTARSWNLYDCDRAFRF